MSDERPSLSEIVRNGPGAAKKSRSTGGHSHDKTLLSKLGFADPDRGSELHDLACQYLLQPEVAVKLAHAFFKAEECDAESQVSAPCNHKQNANLYVQPHTSYPAVSKFDRFAVTESHGELMVGKGIGQYRTTIGFLDLALRFGIYRYEIGDVESFCCAAVDPPEFDEPEPGCIVADAKQWTSWIARRNLRNFERVHTEMESPPRVRCLQHRCCRSAVSIKVPIETKPSLRGDRKIAIEVKAGRTPISDVIRQIALYREYTNEALWLMASPWPITETDKAALKRENIHHVLLADAFNEFVRTSKESPAATSDFSL